MIPSKAELLERWSATARRPKRDLAAALAGEKPELVVITGQGSVAVDDIRAQLRELEAGVDLTVVRVPITQPAEVVRALRQVSGARAVLITRGGGEGVQALDDNELIGAVARSPVPVAVALGHATDDLVIGRVADASFPTPTAFGAWLRSLLERRRDLEREAALAEEVGHSRDLMGRLDELQKARSSPSGPGC